MRRRRSNRGARGEPVDAGYRFRALKFHLVEISHAVTGGARPTAKASELRVSYLSDVPRIHGEVAEQLG
jgi:hypothetical protein